VTELVLNRTSHWGGNLEVVLIYSTQQFVYFPRKKPLNNWNMLDICTYTEEKGAKLLLIVTLFIPRHFFPLKS